jgi:hypothetical protein
MIEIQVSADLVYYQIRECRKMGALLNDNESEGKTYFEDYPALLPG